MLQCLSLIISIFINILVDAYTSVKNKEKGTIMLSEQVQVINGVSPVVHSIKCDIASQWEWSKFDPSQNPNP